MLKGNDHGKQRLREEDDSSVNQLILNYGSERNRRRTSMASLLLLLAISISVAEAFIIPPSGAQQSHSALWIAQELVLERTSEKAKKVTTSIKSKLKASRKQTAMNGYSLAMSSASSNTSNSNRPKKLPVERSTRLPAVEPMKAKTQQDTPLQSKSQVSGEQVSKRKEINNRALYAKSRAVPDSLRHFVAEIHREDRITHSEEIALGEKTQEAARLNSIYDQLKEKLHREPTDEEWCAASGKINMEAISQAIDDGLSAKNKLVTSNLRMVQSVVNTYLRNGLAAHYNAGDLMQEGILALIRAAEKFEPDRGFKFSTYAMYWVRASVKRSQVSQSSIIALPQRLYDDSKKLRRMEADLHTLTGIKPSFYELAVAAGMTEKYVVRCLTANNLRTQSLDHGLANANRGFRDSSEDGSLTSLIADEEIENPEDFIIRQDMMRCLQRHLTTEQLMLLLLRFGVVGKSPATIAELSDLVGQTPDKVRRRIKKSLLQLKEAGIDDEWMSFGLDLSL